MTNSTYPEQDIVFAEPVDGTDDQWLVTLICGHKKFVKKKHSSYLCFECPKVEITDAGSDSK